MTTKTAERKVLDAAKKAVKTETQVQHNAVTADYAKLAEKEFREDLRFVEEGKQFRIPSDLAKTSFTLQGAMTDSYGKWRNNEQRISETFLAGTEADCYKDPAHVQYKALAKFLQLTNPNWRRANDTVESLGALNKRGGPGLTQEQSDQYYGATERLRVATNIIGNVRRTLYSYWKQRTQAKGPQRTSLAIPKFVDRFKATMGRKAQSDDTVPTEKRIAQACVNAMTWIQEDANSFEAAFLRYKVAKADKLAQPVEVSPARGAAIDAAVQAAAANA